MAEGEEGMQVAYDVITMTSRAVDIGGHWPSDTVPYKPRVAFSFLPAPAPRIYLHLSELELSFYGRAGLCDLRHKNYASSYAIAGYFRKIVQKSERKFSYKLSNSGGAVK